jgi:hypothetical protein
MAFGRWVTVFALLLTELNNYSFMLFTPRLTLRSKPREQLAQTIRAFDAVELDSH